MSEPTKADLDRYITGNQGLDQELYDDEAPEDGCDVAPRTRGHNEE